MSENNAIETIPELTARVRQLVAEQTDRKNALMFQSWNERADYAERSVRNALVSRMTEPRPVNLDDIQFAAQFVMWATGEVLTLEELCEILFNHAEEFVKAGLYTSADINAIYWAYNARFN